MDKFDTLDEGISSQKKKIMVDIERNQKLLLLSCFLIIVLSILVVCIYNKYSILLDQLNQIENNTNKKFEEVETHSERIKRIREKMRDYADHADKQNIYNQELNKKLEEIENKIELLKLNDEKIESIVDVNLYKNEIICTYEINEANKGILLYNYENKVNHFPDYDKKEEYEKNIELYLNDKKIKINNIFKAKEPGIYKFKLKFLKHMKDISKFFHKCENLIYVDLSNFKSEDLTDIRYLFSKCINLKKIEGLNNLNTEKVEHMENLFSSCNKLEEINGLNNFKTSNVINMANMFSNCEKLKFLDLTNFDPSKVISFTGTFANCASLNEIRGLSNFKTSNTLEFNSMFASCINLKVLDVSNFDTRKADYMVNMFSGCSNLEEIKGLNKFNTSNVISFDYMFSSCTGLKVLDVSNFDTRNSREMRGMFEGCENLESIKGINNFITDNVIYMCNMFKDCHKLESLDLSSFKTNNVKDFEGMFMNCLNLKLLNLKNFKLLTNDTYSMFKNINKEDCKLIVNDEKIKKIFYDDEIMN